MGLYVCNYNKDFNLAVSFLGMAHKNAMWYVIDTDDATTEVYSSGQIIEYMKMGIHFENIAPAGVNETLVVKSMFEYDKLLRIEPFDMLIVVRKFDFYSKFHVYFMGMYFEFCTTDTYFFTDFTDGTELILHSVSLLEEKELRYCDLIFSKEYESASVRVYGDEEPLYRLTGKDCTRGSFLSRMVLN